MSNQRKYITEKEINYIDALNREVVQDVVSQLVYYYAIVDTVDDDDPYGEVIEKTVLPPIELYPRVLYSDPEQRIGEHGSDIIQTIELYFHKKECDEKSVKIRAGDFVEFSEKYYEITSVVETRLPYGEQSVRLEFKAVANWARKTQFNFPKHPSKEIKNRYSGSQDIMGPEEKEDSLEQWSNPVKDDIM